MIYPSFAAADVNHPNFHPAQMMGSKPDERERLPYRTSMTRKERRASRTPLLTTHRFKLESQYVTLKGGPNSIWNAPPTIHRKAVYFSRVHGGVEQRYVLGYVASLYLTGIRRGFSNNSGVLQPGDDDGEKGER